MAAANHRPHRQGAIRPCRVATAVTGFSRTMRRNLVPRESARKPRNIILPEFLRPLRRAPANTVEQRSGGWLNKFRAIVPHTVDPVGDHPECQNRSGMASSISCTFSLSVVVIHLGIAAGAALGGITVDTLVRVAWVPLTGAIFAAASAALLIGLRSFLPGRRLTVVA